MIKLDEYQQAVVNWRQGEAVVSAAAGSGKSTVLLERTAALLNEGTPPSKILTLVYNRDAAESFRTRLAALLAERGLSAGTAQAVPVYTFHAWGLACLKAWFPRSAQLRSVMGAPGGPSKIKPIYQVMDRVKVKNWPKDWKKWEGFSDFVRDRALDWTTPEGVDGIMRLGEAWAWGTARTGEAIRFLAAYAEAKRNHPAIDFADMTFLVCRAIREYANDPAVVTLRTLYAHVQVDEAQDACPARWIIAQHLAAGAQSLVVVGDPRQSLYSFQGAEPRMMLARLDAGATLLNLPVNRRSTAAIVEHGNAICRGHDWHLGGDCIPSPGVLQDVSQTVPVYMLETDDENEAVEVIAHLRKRFAPSLGYGVVASERYYADYAQPSQIAILSRTNAGLIPFEMRAIVARIPARVLGRPGGSWESTPGREIRTYLEMAAGDFSNDVWLIANKPNRYCRKDDVYGWATAQRAITRALKGDGRGALRPPAATGKGVLRLYDNLQALAALTWQARVERVVGWLVAHWNRENKPDGEDGSPFEQGADDDAVAAYKLLGQAAIEAGSLDGIRVQIKAAIEAERSGQAVTLATVHRSKGAEWDFVYATGLRAGMLPHRKATDLEEERRIYYVASTRAKRELVVSGGGPWSTFVEPDEDEDGSMSLAEDGSMSLAEAATYERGSQGREGGPVPREFLPEVINEQTRFIVPEDEP